MESTQNNAGIEVAALLMAATDVAARASLVAAVLVEQLQDCACAVHRLVAEDGDAAWVMVGMAGPISPDGTSTQQASRLMAPLLAGSHEPIILPGDGIRREDYAHLHVTRSIASIAYLPLLHENQLLGAVEILSFSMPLRPQDLDAVAPILQLAPVAIAAAEDFEEQHQALLDSVHRMSQLYDLEKSLNSTLDLDAVIAMIPTKAAAMLPCQAIHLWLFDGDLLRLVSSCGRDATVEVGMMQAPGEGYVADMAEEGEPLLIVDAKDDRFALRNAGVDAGGLISPIANALLVPLMQDEAEVGVLESVNREEHPFDEDDQFLCLSMAETISNALKNANLLLAERKLEILKALVHVSGEITSTLRLDRLLQIIVNSPQTVLPYERCSIALDHRGRLQLKAVSGMTSLPLGDVHVERLNGLIRWLSAQSETLDLRWKEKSGDEAPAEIPEPALRHFQETGQRAIYSLPLVDDQGRVGLMVYESSDPEFLEVSHVEMIKVLAAQATVAIRNAMLYREVPLIGLIEPLVRKKNALLSTRRGRWMTFGIVFECALFLGFCPLPLRVSGDAVIAPQHLVTLAAPVDGNVTAVYAQEGQRVVAGDVLGAMNDWQWRTELASAEAKYQAAVQQMESDLALGNAKAGTDRVTVEYLRSEAERARARVDEAQLRSPIDGVVVTPNLQNVAGKHLDAGTQFAQVLDLSRARVQVAVPERDVTLLSQGLSVAVKLDSYPQRTWRGRLSIVSPDAHVRGGERMFIAEVDLTNPADSLRAGMTGRAKIFDGWHPAGYVLLRRPAMWVWQTLWDWIGW